MNKWANKQSNQSAFTIVELLIVVVVIAILAAITIVSYNGITKRADESSAKSAVSQAFKKIETYKIAEGSYPSSLVVAGVPSLSGYAYDYRSFADSSCVSATKGAIVYHVSSDNPSPTYGTCGQVKAEYFNNVTLSGTPALVRYDDKIDNQWGGQGPGPEVGVDNFSARYTSFITAPVSGAYTFYTLADDAEKVIVNNVTLGDYFTTGPCCTLRAMPTTINLIAGQSYPLQVEYKEGAGSAYMRLFWSYPGQSQTDIPVATFTRLKSN